MKKKIYIIDASPIFYKAFFAIKELSSKDGKPTNAAYGFTKSMIGFLKKENPEYVAVCFDSPRNLRKEQYSEYKVKRNTSSKLITQIPLIKQVTELLGLKGLELNGYEADDLIGMIHKFFMEKTDFEIYIVSPDKDLCQLVNDRTFIYDLSKKTVASEKEIMEKHGVPPYQIADLLALSGDPSDGIPGLSGVGQKTAVKILQKYGSVENILNSPEAEIDLKGKLSADGKKILKVSKSLATVNSDYSLLLSESSEISDFEKMFVDKKEIIPFFEALNFFSLMASVKDLD